MNRRIRLVVLTACTLFAGFAQAQNTGFAAAQARGELVVGLSLIHI